MLSDALYAVNLYVCMCVCVQVVDMRTGSVGGGWVEGSDLYASTVTCAAFEVVVSSADTGEKTARATAMLCNADTELGNSGQELSNSDGLTGPPAEGGEQESQYLVKWAGQSHIHNTWETGELVLGGGAGRQDWGRGW